MPYLPGLSRAGYCFNYLLFTPYSWHWHYRSGLRVSSRGLYDFRSVSFLASEQVAEKV
jgi:hypothetical protein